MNIMTDNEHRTLERAKSRLAELTDIELSTLQLDRALEDTYSFDYLVNLKFTKHLFDVQPIKFYAIVKRILSGEALNLWLYQIQNRFPNNAHQVLLITDYLTQEKAQKLKDANVCYLDAAGNAYITGTGLYLWISGQKNPNLKSSKHLRAFQEAGVKIIFTLLNQPGLADKPKREIAEIAQVSLGSVSYVMNDLFKLNYLVELRDKNGILFKERNFLTAG